MRAGNEIAVKDRNRIIARLVPAAPSAAYDEELLELAAQGKLRLPETPLDQAAIAETLNRKLPRLRTAAKAGRKKLQQIMDEERGAY